MFPAPDEFKKMFFHLISDPVSRLNAHLQSIPSAPNGIGIGAIQRILELFAVIDRPMLKTAKFAFNARVTLA